MGARRTGRWPGQGVCKNLNGKESQLRGRSKQHVVGKGLAVGGRNIFVVNISGF